MPECDRPAAASSLTDRVELLEKDLIVDALKATRGNVAAAARRLGITPRIIRYKMKKLRISGKSRRKEVLMTDRLTAHGWREWQAATRWRTPRKLLEGDVDWNS